MEEMNMPNWTGLVLKLKGLVYISVLLSSAVANADEQFKTSELISKFYMDSKEDKKLSNAFQEQAESANRNADVKVKLWCEAAHLAPSIKNLTMCAKWRLKSVNNMSNPKPFMEEAKMSVAKEAMNMLVVALHIAGGDSTLSAKEREQLSDQYLCYREISKGESHDQSCESK